MTDGQLLNRSLLVALASFALTLVAAGFAFLWPNTVEPEGPHVVAGTVLDVRQAIERDDHPLCLEEHPICVVPYGEDVLGLDMRSTHMGHPVVYCASSGWFEEPMHASRFNVAGEVMPSSPAYAGLDRHPVTVAPTGEVIVDTEAFLDGPPKGTNTLEKIPPKGPHCV